MHYTDILTQTYFSIATLIVGVVLLRRLTSIGRLILIIVASNVIIDLYTTSLALQEINTMFYNSVFTSYEQVLILYIYSLFHTERKYKTTILIFCVCLILFSIYNLTAWQGFDTFNTFTFIPAGLIVATLSYLIIRKIILNEDNFQHQFLFWFSVANFQYYIVVAPSLSAILWANETSINLGLSFKQINNISYSIWAIIIAIGFICQEKKTI